MTRFLGVQAAIMDFKRRTLLFAKCACPQMIDARKIPHWLLLSFSQFPTLSDYHQLSVPSGNVPLLSNQ